jgi:hypothetical protein
MGNMTAGYLNERGAYMDSVVAYQQYNTGHTIDMYHIAELARYNGGIEIPYGRAGWGSQEVNLMFAQEMFWVNLGRGALKGAKNVVDSP